MYRTIASRVDEAVAAMASSSAAVGVAAEVEGVTEEGAADVAEVMTDSARSPLGVEGAAPCASTVGGVVARSTGCMGEEA